VAGVDPGVNIGNPIARRPADLDHGRVIASHCGNLKEAPGQPEVHFHLGARQQLIREERTVLYGAASFCTLSCGYQG
jgi:hypothetical protein